MEHACSCKEDRDTKPTDASHIPVSGSTAATRGAGVDENGGKASFGDGAVARQIAVKSCTIARGTAQDAKNKITIPGEAKTCLFYFPCQCPLSLTIPGDKPISPTAGCWLNGDRLPHRCLMALGTS